MADKKPTVNFITPAGVFIFPKLTQPDEYKGKVTYNVKLRLKPDAIPAELTAKLEDLRDKLLAEKKAEFKAAKNGAALKTLKAVDVWKPEIDKETGDETGCVMLSAKTMAEGVSKRDGKKWFKKLKLFAASGKELDPSKIQIWGGTTGKLSIAAYAYHLPKENEVGVGYRLEAAQILKLVSGSDKDAAGYGFGAEEGYAGEDDAGAEAPSEEGASGGEAAENSAGSGDEF